MSSIYDKNYVQKTYGSNSKTDYPKKLVEKIFGNFPIKTKILDIGCGTGEIASEIDDLNMEIYGIDWSLEAQSKLPPNRFIQTDLVKGPYPYPDNYFDVIFSKSVIEHLREPDILVKEAYRMLKPNGKIITMAPSWLHSYKEAFYIDHTHVTPFTRYSLKMLHEMAGFGVVTCEYFYQLPELWQNKFLLPAVKIIQKMEIPYRPFSENMPWSDKLNKFIRFSQEPMLYCTARKV